MYHAILFNPTRAAQLHLRLTTPLLSHSRNLVQFLHSDPFILPNHAFESAHSVPPPYILHWHPHLPADFNPHALPSPTQICILISLILGNHTLPPATFSPSSKCDKMLFLAPHLCINTLRPSILSHCHLRFPSLLYTMLPTLASHAIHFATFFHKINS